MLAMKNVCWLHAAKTKKSVPKYFLKHHPQRSWDTVVIIVTKLQIGLSGFGLPAGQREFSLLQNIQTGSGNHPASY
jgi:hypothetical protein